MVEREDYIPPGTCFKSSDIDNENPSMHVVNSQPLLDWMTNRVGTQEILPEALHLMQLGRDLEGHDFCFEPVLVSMVAVMLSKVGGLCDSEMSKLRTSVANSLYDNIESRERVRRLWEQLKNNSGRIS